MHRYCTRLTLLAIVIFLQGCITRPLEINDKNAPSFALRATFRIDEAKSNGIEVGYSHVKASGSSTLYETSPANFSPSFNLSGPDTVSSQAKADRAFVAFNKLLFQNRPFELEWFAGLAYDRLNWTAKPSLSQTSSNITLSAVQVTGGATGRYKFVDSWALEGRFRGAAGSVLSGVRAELSVVYRPTALPLRFHLGYAGDSIGVNKNANARLDFQSKGPFASLQYEY